MMSPAIYPDRIWFHPAKFWAVTGGMSQEEADRLLNEVIALAIVRDFDTLRKFPFVSVGPYKWAA